MPSVNTLRGPVDTSKLGVTLMHEHISIRTPGIAENWPELFDSATCLAEAKDRLAAAQAAGVGAMVDLTTADLGRDIPFLTKVAALSNINLILCTGIYWSAPRYWHDRPIEDLVRVFVKDIRQGIAGTGVKAGIIKLATDELAGGCTPLNEKCLRAGARAHRATGVPIATHNGPPTTGRDQQRVFADEGVDLARVVIGHVGDTTDTGFLKELMDQGSCIGMDRFGLDRRLSFDDRVDTVAQLCQDGYADRMVLAHDASCCLDWFADRAAVLQAMPRWHFSHICNEVVPALRERGVSQTDIDQMLIGNPRRLFENQAPY